MLGISICGPILEIGGKDRLGFTIENKLFGVTCTDLRTTGKLDDYFTLDTSKAEQGTNFFVIFNPDSKSTSIQK